MNKEVPQRSWIYDEATALLKRAQEFRSHTEIGTKEATVEPIAEYPSLPRLVLLMTDPHYGSINTNYDLLNRHLAIVEDTPNTYMLSNGDDVDNFNAMFFSSGAFENPLPPQLQTQAYMQKLTQLSSNGKLLGLSFGNHNDFMEDSGYKWLDTFAGDIADSGVPIFPTGGLLHVLAGHEHYGIALTHRYWGNSKINPTNAAKRFLEYEYGGVADVSFLGHTHQSELLTFDKAGRERIALIGGTYKERDDWSAGKGISHRSGQPGMAILFYPGQHKMEAYKHVEDAQARLLGMIFMEEQKGLPPVA